MKHAIIFATKQGCTEKCAIELNKQISNSELINLEINSQIDLSSYESIIIGGSIQAGRINKLVSKFIEEKHNTILTKKIGLFISCMDEKLAEKQFNEAFPNDIIKKAAAKGLFGGEFNFEKMNAFEKAIIKKMTGIEESISKINHEAISDFAKKIEE